MKLIFTVSAVSMIVASLFGCAQNGEQSPFAPETLTTTAPNLNFESGTAIAAKQVSAEDVVGMWMPEGAYEDMIMIDSKYVDDTVGVVTNLYGLNLEREFGYTFLSTATDDKLTLEVNPDTNEIQTLTRKPHNNVGLKVFKIIVRHLDAETIEIESRVAGQVTKRNYKKQPSFSKAKINFLQTQKRRSIGHLEAANNHTDAGCNDPYRAYFRPRHTVCIKDAIKAHPELRLRGETLAQAVKNSNSALVAYLLADTDGRKGMNPNLGTSGGGSILEEALNAGINSFGIPHHGLVSTELEKADIVKFLVEAGAELNLTNRESALTTVSKRQPDPAVMNLMLDNGAEYAAGVNPFSQGFVLFFTLFQGDWETQGLPLVERLIKEANAELKIDVGNGYGGLLAQAALNAPLAVLKLLEANGLNMKGHGAIEECEREKAFLVNLIAKGRLSRHETEILTLKVARLDSNIAYLKTFLTSP